MSQSCKKNFNSRQKKSMWKKYHGVEEHVLDVFELKMNRSDFTADHILPKSCGGRAHLSNCIPLSHASNEEKSNLLEGEINGHTFYVKNLENGTGELFVDGEKVSISKW